MNGNGKVISLLERIAEGQDQLRDELAQFRVEVDARFAQVDARFAQVDARFAQVDARFDKIEARLDNMLGFLGRHHRELDDRVVALERVTGKSSG